MKLKLNYIVTTMISDIKLRDTSLITMRVLLSFERDNIITHDHVAFPNMT